MFPKFVTTLEQIVCDKKRECANTTTANANSKAKECLQWQSKNVVPEARAALDKFKMEAASEVGVNLKQGYNGDLTSKQAGSVGGQMVKKNDQVIRRWHEISSLSIFGQRTVCRSFPAGCFSLHIHSFLRICIY